MAACSNPDLADPEVVSKLKAKKTPCTVCPISNHRAQIVPRIFCGESPIRPMIEGGVNIAGLHSDDPAYCAIGTVDKVSSQRDQTLTHTLTVRCS